MSVEITPRKVLRAAIELHVLETDDARLAGHPTTEPHGIVRALVERGLFAERVVAALTRLVALLEAPAAEGSTVAPAKGTRLPTRAPSRPPATRGGTVAPPERKATYAVEQDGARLPEGLAVRPGATCAPEHDDARPVRLGDRGATCAPAHERTAAATETVDLSVLDADSKRVVEDAAWCRAALLRGLVTRDQLDTAKTDSPGAILAERLVASGAVDAAEAMAIHVEIQDARLVCASCLEVLDVLPGEGETCPSCQQPWHPRTTGSRSGRTIVTPERSESIEGFPGEGGVFAGYELLERVAEGGMGVVFRARQTRLNRIVALKVMRGGSLASKTRKRRFLLEAEAAAGLKHPGIVPVHEIEEVSGYPFYTMDFVDGLPLNEHVKSKKLDPRAIVGLVRCLADAVNHFHLHGIIHRDLKPENILVGPDGAPKIIDFGIAKKLGDSTGATIEGDVLGTLHYMSPEQSAGRVREVDTRTDVYALGAILYELLTGAPPWSNHSDARLVVAIQDDDPDSIRAKNALVDGDLEAIVLKAMAKERERRYQSAAELAEDLENHANQRPIRARPATLVYRVRKAVKRRLPVFVAGSVTSVFVAAGLGLYAWRLISLRREVATLLAAAEDRSEPGALRQKQLERVLFLSPENAVAQARLDALAAEQRAATALAAEQTRRKQENLENQLARERAERDANAAKERERARIEAEARAAAASEQRARELAEATKTEKSELSAIRRLDEALACLPKGGASELRSEVEARKAELEIRQTRTALDASQSGLADFWLQDLAKLDGARDRKSEVLALEGRLERLASGESDLDEARLLLRGGDLIAARARFEHARASGVAAERLTRDLEAVSKACLARAEALVGDGRSRLSSGDAAGGMAKAAEARRFASDLASVAALERDCEAQIVREARRVAATLWRRDDGRRQALAVLDQAAHLVVAPAESAALRRERAARAHLLDEPALEGLVFVPDAGELSIEAFYIARAEVTDGEFRAFIADRGYERLELWDDAARALLPTFRDGCAVTCSHHAPRTWVDGGFGDDANANRPVSGVSFYEARAFARWRSEKTGARWRLPRDREWEAAAGWDPVDSRLRRFPWGDDWRAALALGGHAAAPAGSALEDCSPLGVVDCGGNVREWVERRGGEPGTKGADFVGDEAAARHYADVSVTATPGANPSSGLLRRVGFRLVREIEVER
jgi:tRNA A-37 threonylcarbamoyl transferase component Bud32